MPRSDTLLRSVLRWTPRDRAERQKLPRLDFSEATMNCRSNSRLACSRVKPRRTSSSTIWYRRPLRFWSAKTSSLENRKDSEYHRRRAIPRMGGWAVAPCPTFLRIDYFSSSGSPTKTADFAWMILAADDLLWTDRTAISPMGRGGRPGRFRR